MQYLLRSRSLLILSLLVAANACDCDGGLNQIPQPSAELAAGDDVTPPLEILEIDLGTALIGSPLDTEFTIRSVGDADLVIQSIELIEDTERCPVASTDFRLDLTDVPESVAPESSATFTVEFNPSVGGSGCTVVELQTDDEVNPILLAVITGAGDAPRLCVDRIEIDFGDILVTETAEDAFVLTSCGSRPITLESITNSGSFPPFGAEMLTLPLVLAPGDEVNLPVSFSPVIAGTYSPEAGTGGTITLQTDDGAAAYTLSLRANALPQPICTLSIAPTVLNLGTVLAGEMQTGTAIVRNDGGADCTINTLNLMTGTEFSLDFPTYAVGDILTPGSIVNLNVTFNAPSTAGTYNDSILVEGTDVGNPQLSIALQANVPGEDGCQIAITPATANFGVVPPGILRNREIVLENISGDPCFLTGSSLVNGTDPGFIDTAANLGIIFPGNSKTLAVSFLGQATPGAANGTLLIETNDDDTPDFEIPLFAQSGPPGICVEPRHLAFGETNVSTDLQLTITACGTQTIIVSGLPWLETDDEFSIPNPPAFPQTLNPGDQLVVTVRYDPVDMSPDYGKLVVESNDLAYPSLDVEVTGGPEIVPADAGRYLYYWRIPTIASDIIRLPLQGNIQADPYWGTSTGKGCSGCHRISPDGKYLALMEVGTLKIVDTETDTALDLGPNFADPTYFSWRPNVDTDPPYQFVYSNGSDLLKGALFAGDLGVLSGADDPVLFETMPTWGPNGSIVFARGEQAIMSDNGAGSGLTGPSDLMIIPEDGGTPIMLTGASENTAGNYYPQFSPNGLWVAFTQSISAGSTLAAPDAQILLVDPSGGGVDALSMLNGNNGANSYPTWSVNGEFLSFSSDRSGGAGDWDIYIAGIDPMTGVAQAALNLNDFQVGNINTSAFEHAAQWSP